MKKPPDPFTFSSPAHLSVSLLPLNHHGDMLLLSHQVKILHHHNFRPSLPNGYDYDNPSLVICDLGSRSVAFSSTAHFPASLLPLNHHGAVLLIFQSHQFKILHHHNLRPALPNVYDYEVICDLGSRSSGRPHKSTGIKWKYTLLEMSKPNYLPLIEPYLPLFVLSTQLALISYSPFKNLTNVRSVEHRCLRIGLVTSPSFYLARSWKG